MTENRAVQHAFWLYGVIVGMALKTALETSVPHLINPPRLITELLRAGEQVPFQHTLISYPEILRLGIFLALTIRFTTGSAFYFGEVYESENSEKDYPKKNYGLDLVLGFIHFLFFFCLALTIDFHTTPIHWFPLFVGIILIYDAIWWGFSFRLSTGRLLFLWMIINVITALLSALIYVCFLSASHNPIKAEIWALWPVAMVSVLDLGLMMGRRPFFNVRKIFPPAVPPVALPPPPLHK